MHSMNAESGDLQPMQPSNFSKMQPVDFALTHEQYLIIQHFLPKRYALIEHKNIKKNTGNSAMKLCMQEGSLPQMEGQNVSKLSGNVENTEQIQGRLKRVRTKKIDKYLQDEMPKIIKKTITEVPPQDQIAQCSYILSQLRKHKSSHPFLIPVDPKRDGVLNYFDIVKQPMDLLTVQNNLNTGVYTSASQFHVHVSRIWSNSYTFNQNGTLMSKLTMDLERYYKSLLNNQGMKKSIKNEKSKYKQDKQKFNNKVSDAGEDKDQLKKSQSFGSYPYNDNQ